MSESRGIELTLVRHADAGDPGAWPGPDEARPLSAKGRRQVRRLARYLATIGVRADALVSSPKIRAIQTAAPIGKALGVEVRTDNRLAAGFGMPGLAAIVAESGAARRLILVGHDPDFSELLSALMGATIPMRKGAAARIDLEGEPARAGGVLRWLIPPDALPR